MSDINGSSRCEAKPLLPERGPFRDGLAPVGGGTVGLIGTCHGMRVLGRARERYGGWNTAMGRFEEGSGGLQASGVWE